MPIRRFPIAAATCILLASACDDAPLNFGTGPTGYVNDRGEPCDLTPGLAPPIGYALDTLGSLAGLNPAGRLNHRSLRFASPQRGYLLSLQLTSGERTVVSRTDDGGVTWRRLPFPESRDPRGLACHGVDTCVVAVQTPGPALGYVTFDGGGTWDTIGRQLGIGELTGLRYDDAGRLYATTQPYSGGRVVRSDDHGRTWHSVGERDGIRRLTFVPGSDELLFSLAEGGRFVAMDTAGGVRYETTTPLRGAYTTDFLQAIDRDHVALFSRRTVYTSSDGGRTWRSSDERVSRLVGFETPTDALAVTVEESCVDYDVGLTREVFAVTDDGAETWAKPAVRSTNLGGRLRTCDYLGDGAWRCVLGGAVVALRRA